MPPKKIFLFLAAALLGCGLFFGAVGSGVALAQTLDEAVEEAVQGARAGAVSQLRVDELDDEARALFAEYRTALRRVETLESYRDRLQQLVGDQQDDIRRREKNIANVQNFERDLFPAMERMTDAIERFVGADLPFLPEERSARVARLKQLLTRSDVTASEKFRQLMEAFQVESDYGRTIEAWRGNINQGHAERVVDFLRVGRSLLVYQTLDGAESARWDAATAAWHPLEDAWRADIRRGLRIARKQTTPGLLLLPFAAPVAREDLQ